MKILLISPLPPPAGGIASWTKRFIEYHNDNRQDEVLIVNTALIGKRAANAKKNSLTEEFTRTFNIFKELIGKIKDHNIDVAHLNSPCSRLGLIRDCICAIIIKKNKIPIVTHFRCDVSYMIRDKIALFLLRRLAILSDIIISLNTSSLNYIQKNCGKDSVIIPNFLPENYINAAKESKQIRDRVYKIIYVGHITKAKGCDLIIRLAERMPEFQFIMVGSLKNDMEDIPRGKNIRLTNEIPSDMIINELKEADLFIFPSKTEGFPNAVAEAMACGLPVVATPVGAIPDMIEQEGGVLLGGNDIDGFENAILKLSDSTRMRAKMSEWNKKKAQYSYNIDEVNETLFRYYNQLVQIKEGTI